MSRHPASEDLLFDYATGALAEGPALAVALHVALDRASRRTVDTLHAVGGALLDREPASEMDETSLESVLSRLDGVTVQDRPRAPPTAWSVSTVRRDARSSAT